MNIRTKRMLLCKDGWSCVAKYMQDREIEIADELWSSDYDAFEDYMLTMCDKYDI